MEPARTIPLPSVEATLALGTRLAANVQPGDVIALCGGLGAGKTHLTKGIAAALGITAEVSSPTFTLVHEYPGGRLPVAHFDFYRMASPDEVLALGWDEYLDTPGLCIVEWADLHPGLLPPHTTWWHLALHPDGTRSARPVPAGEICQAELPG